MGGSGFTFICFVYLNEQHTPTVSNANTTFGHSCSFANEHVKHAFKAWMHPRMITIHHSHRVLIPSLSFIMCLTVEVKHKNTKI